MYNKIERLFPNHKPTAAAEMQPAQRPAEDVGGDNNNKQEKDLE